MSSEQNEYSYTSQFAGILRAESERIPFHVSTRLRMRTDGTASEVRNCKNSGHGAAPQYVLSNGEDPLLTPSWLATGRHYFRW